MESRIDKLINYQPGWIIRNGNLLFILFLCLFLYSLYFIRYAKTVTSFAYVQPVSTQGESGFSVMLSTDITSHIQPGDAAVIKWKAPDHVSDSLRVTVVVVNVNSDNRKDSAAVKLRPVKGNDSFATTGKIWANISITIEKERFSDVLWNGMKDMFAMNRGQKQQQ